MSAPNSTSNVNTVSIRRALLIVAVSSGFGLAFDYLFYGKLPGISFPIYTVLLLGGIFYAARRFKTKIPPTAYGVTVPLLFFAAMLAVRADGFVSFLNVVATLYLLTLLLRVIFKPKLYNYSPLAYLTLPLDVLARTVGSLRHTISDLRVLREFVAKHQKAPQYVRGVLISIPLLALFMLLFSSADLVFRKYTSDLFNFNINQTVVGWTFWGLLVALATAGIFSYLYQVPEETSAPADTAPLRRSWGSTTEVSIIFGSLNALFLSFILVQIRYLFGGQQNITGAGFTYAEYARKGFFELLAVAVISYLLIWGVERLLLRPGQKHALPFRLLSTGLIVQVGVIMVSAFKRLALYENAYGYTSLRLYVQIIIVWLAVVFGVLLYKILKDQRESTFAFLLFASVILLFAAVNAFNVDSFVARKNIERYEVTGKLDIGYLSELSDDSVVETVRLLDAKDPWLRESFARFLYVKRRDLEYRDVHWQSANMERKAALRALNAHASQLEHR